MSTENNEKRELVRTYVRAGFTFSLIVVHAALTLSFMHSDKEWSDGSMQLLSSLLTVASILLVQAAGFYFRGSDDGPDA